MMREYRNGDGLKVAVQKMQADEAVEGAAYFDHVGKYSLVKDDGEILAVFGYAGEAGRIADCYALVSQEAGRHLLEAVRFLQKEIPAVLQRCGFSGVRMTVRVGFDAGGRFAKMLGFEPAGMLPDFYNGNDYQLFERI